MTSKQLLVIIVCAAIAAVISVLIVKYALNIEGPGVIGGGVAGGVAGALGGGYASRKK